MQTMHPSHTAASAYGKIGLETGVFAASPHKLILMLFEGAQLAVNIASRQMRQGDIAARGEAISKAITIISSGLKSSLDLNKGGQIAASLDALYDYMCQRLLTANLKNQPELLDEVNALLGELHTAWKQIPPPTAGFNPATLPDKTRSSLAA